MSELFCAAHDRLIARIAEHVRDGRVLDALRGVPRGLFVDGGRDAGAAEADADAPAAAELSDPMVVARMCEVLELRGHERVLHVGTRRGYQAAVLAALTARVVTVGPSSAIAERARHGFRRAGITNVETLVGDPAELAPLHGPFHAIVMSAASSQRRPSALEEQLIDGGRLLAPLADGRRLLLARRRDGGRHVRLLPLVANHQLT